MKGLTKQQQPAVVRAIRDRGMTVEGWAKVNRLPMGSVRNVLYREYGRRPTLTPTAAKIVNLMREQGLARERKG